MVVNAAGPFAITVGRWVGLELPIYQMRRQRVFVAPHPKIPQDAPLIMDVDNESYWRPETGGALLGWHDPEEQKSDPMEDPQGDWDFPALTLEMCSRLSPFWIEVVEDLKQEDLSVYAGQYVHAPDDQPIIGPVTGIPGLLSQLCLLAGGDAVGGGRPLDLRPDHRQDETRRQPAAFEPLRRGACDAAGGVHARPTLVPIKRGILRPRSAFSRFGILDVALLRLRFQYSCGLDLNHNLPLVEGHWHNGERWKVLTKAKWFRNVIPASDIGSFTECQSKRMHGEHRRIVMGKKMKLGLHTYTLHLWGLGQNWGVVADPRPKEMTLIQLMDKAVEWGLDGLHITGCDLETKDEDASRGG